MWFVNSLWPDDAIWRHIIGSTFVQVMACCLMAPSHYLNQCWLIISEILWHAFQTAISQQMLMNLVCNMSLEITLLKLLKHLPEANELCSYFTSQSTLYSLFCLGKTRKSMKLHFTFLMCMKASWPALSLHKGPWNCLTVKIFFCHYRNSNYKGKTVVTSYLYNRNTYTSADGIYIETGPCITESTPIEFCQH